MISFPLRQEVIGYPDHFSKFLLAQSDGFSTSSKRSDELLVKMLIGLREILYSLVQCVLQLDLLA